MDLVEHDVARPHGPEERLGIAQPLGDTRQIAVQQFGLRQARRQARLADTPGPGQPGDAGLSPGGIETSHPDWSGDHNQTLHLDA
jgi:hypothetical protein